MSVTLREVARTVGVSHTAAYRHYADKQTLLAALAEIGFERLMKKGSDLTPNYLIRFLQT